MIVKCAQRQVFYNLVMNALKFTKKGEVRISSLVDAAGTWVKLSIADTGIGINPSHKQRIFEPFEQEDDSEARVFEGIGLGLSISREVVRRHGGDISVQSEVGRGSIFSVALPQTFCMLFGRSTILLEHPEFFWGCPYIFSDIQEIFSTSKNFVWISLCKQRWDEALPSL